MNPRYSVILGNLGNTRDRFCTGYKQNLPTPQMLAKAAAIAHVQGIELVGTWDVTPDTASDMKKAMDDLGIRCVSIIPDLFTDPVFAHGSFSHRDASVRQRAIDDTRKMCDVAGQMDCDLLCVWPGQDGYDYLLTADYEKQRAWFCEAVQTIAREYPDLRLALEYKPREPRTHSLIARMADTLLMCQETGCDNVGVTIDTGHAFNAGEVVAEAVVLAKRANDRLMHMHFNDNHAVWDDDMIVGSVHTVCYIEMLYYLDRCAYNGWYSMDQYPYREDAAGAIGESIQWLRLFDQIVRENREQLGRLIALGDAIEVSKFVRGVLGPRPR